MRVASALVLAPLAVGTAYVGGWTLAAFWAVAAMVVFWEWVSLAAGSDRRSVLYVGAAALLLALALAASSVEAEAELRHIRLLAALIMLVMGMLASAIIAPAGRVLWLTAAIPYAGATGIAPIVLRSDGEHGFAALILLFAIVWATDIAAYFVGRAVGGPKLVPRWSPNKTWSGAMAGVAGAVIAALAVASAFGLRNATALALLAAVLSAVAQAGDVFESVLKRHFGVKDSGRLIPGHGGLMDRVDGFVAAAVVACAIGLVRGGIEAPAHGLLVW